MQEVDLPTWTISWDNRVRLDDDYICRVYIPDFAPFWSFLYPNPWSWSSSTFCRSGFVDIKPSRAFWKNLGFRTRRNKIQSVTTAMIYPFCTNKLLGGLDICKTCALNRPKRGIWWSKRQGLTGRNYYQNVPRDSLSSSWTSTPFKVQSHIKDNHYSSSTFRLRLFIAHIFPSP